jgi:hypothetical protein
MGSNTLGRPPRIIPRTSSNSPVVFAGIRSLEIAGDHTGETVRRIRIFYSIWADPHGRALGSAWQSLSQIPAIGPFSNISDFQVQYRLAFSPCFTPRHGREHLFHGFDLFVQRSVNKPDMQLDYVIARVRRKHLISRLVQRDQCTRACSHYWRGGDGWAFSSVLGTTSGL